MPTDLLESNLFGHVRGAFTGAVANKKGLFEAAEGGSIFFDEIGTISLETQAKLLRLIQEKEFLRVGSVETQKADVRIIAATNVDLKKMVAEGRFRDDLYYRLCVITVSISPLRERREDIPMLAEHFLRLYASENNKSITGIAPDAMRALLDHDWPGNVRELENALERAVVLCPGGGAIGLELLPENVLSPERDGRGRAPAGERLDLQGNGRGIRAPARADGTAAHRRRPEARRGPAARQADDAARDHQAAGDPGARKAARGIRALRLCTVMRTSAGDGLRPPTAGSLAR